MRSASSWPPTGPVFSAGHNFGDMRGADLADARRLFQICTEMMDAVQEIPQPVVAKVHALATAAGCQLVASCDLAVASEDAAFAIPGGKGGLFCHTPLVAVARNIGRKRALEMAFTGDPIDARTAADWGLINKVVPADQLDEATWDLITRATRGSIESKGLGKQGFYAQVGRDQDSAYAFAIELMSSAAMIPDAQEGFAAFLEKRKPRVRPPLADPQSDPPPGPLLAAAVSCRSVKLSMMLNYAGGFKESVDQIVELEKAGLDLVWIPEAYSFDAISQVGYLAARTERLEIGTGHRQRVLPDAGADGHDGGGLRLRERRPLRPAASAPPGRRWSKGSTACRTRSRWPASRSTSTSAA